MTPESLMQLAIDAALQGIQRGQSPFGCAIAHQDQILACTHNTVLDVPDITAHAEVNAVREACRKHQRLFLEDCIVATTCEPCPMCMSALHWARVDQVYYGASIADASRAGFNELQLPAAELLQRGQSQLQLIPGILTQQCQQLFDQWLSRGERTVY